ncbi:interleukin-12 receptor subunit beta-2 [Amblyraja radiata]|uniref:interleukin-12 receptor subunit beta-2 n=1 Tax=Amblyraja radiata TaxID=386614 RepID=UPI001403BDAB|nr:interleukin-12 receptor subunit beta-2 [Amblyraja radiata]
MEFVGTCWVTNLFIILLCMSRRAESCANGEMQVSPATVVRLGSSINISCILKGSSYGQCAARQLCIIENNNRRLVATQISANAVAAYIPKIENPKSTFACKLHCNTEYLICGIDIKAGNPPDRPQNLKCIQKGRVGDIMCTWDAGHDTYISTKTILRFRNESHSFIASATSAELSTGKCTRPRKTLSHQRLGFACEFGHRFDPFSTYLAWVTVSNQLGSQSSAVMTFALDGIAKPSAPNISRIECSGSTLFNCTIYWNEEQNAEWFEIQFQITNSSKWEKKFIANSTSCTMADLEHFEEYVFKIRSKFLQTRGLWSDWSSSFVTRTPEAAPIGQLDAWYTMDLSDPNNLRVTLFWKPLKVFEVRGRVLGYNITLQESIKNNTTIWIQQTKKTWYTGDIPRAGCVITASVYNCRGSSPPTQLHLSSLRDLPPASNISTMYSENNWLLIEWMEPVKPPVAVQGYVVMWTEVNDKLNQNINWIKLPPQNRSARLTENIKPKTCFQISVFAVYDNGAGIPLSIWKYTAPKDHTAAIFWNIPQVQKESCTESYTIHKREKGSKLPPTIYATHLYPDSKSIMAIVVAVTLLAAVVVSVFCLRQSVRTRILLILSKLVSRLYVSNIPDPANCTWAKKYTAIKGNLDLTCPFYQADSTATYEDPEILQLEEMSSGQEICSSMEAIDQDQNSQLSTFQIQPTASQPQPSEESCQEFSPRNSQEDILDYKCQLPCLYVEKLSSVEIDHQFTDSQNSAVDQSIGYIPSNFIHVTDTETKGQGFVDSFAFMPLPSLSRMEITFEGKLTLDVVRIDCSSLVE